MTVTVSEFELENVGAGDSPFQLQDVLDDEDTSALVLLLQRDYHCTKCRKQVQDVADRYDEFQAENAVVASVLPESADRARNWQESYDLPYPLLADPATELSDGLEQPTRFGILGSLHDMIGRMPEAIVVDVRGAEPSVSYVHRGASPSDRPSIDELLKEVRQVSSPQKEA